MKGIKMSEQVKSIIPANFIEKLEDEFYSDVFLGEELVVLEKKSYEVKGKERTKLFGVFVNELGDKERYLVICWEKGSKEEELLFIEKILAFHFDKFKQLTEKPKRKKKIS